MSAVRRSLPVRILRGLAFTVLGFIGLVMLVLLAWIASNVIDRRAEPLPTELALPAPSGESPMFLALTGLLAAPGDAPVDTGRRLWDALTAGTDAATALAVPQALARPQGKPFTCQGEDDCGAQWLEGVDALAAQLAPHAAVGQRCVAALDAGVFVEALPRTFSVNTPASPHTQNAALCAQWFAADAVLAAERGERERSLQRLGQGRRFAGALLEGSQTLIGNAVAWRAARWHYHATSAVLQRQPAWLPALHAEVTPLPAQALAPRRWVATEAAYQRGALDGLGRDCDKPNGDIERGWLERTICETGIGLLPEATRQLINKQWQQTLADAAGGVEPMTERLVAARADGSRGAPAIAWRNTFGHLLLGTVQEPFDGYFARQADVELHRKTLELALRMHPLPATDRAAWLQQQALPERQRARMKLGTDALTARPWVAEYTATSPAPTIRVPLPASAPN